MAGAAVACDQDVAKELRAWRQRMGGTLFGMTPYALSAPGRAARRAAADR